MTTKGIYCQGVLRVIRNYLPKSSWQEDDEQISEKIPFIIVFDQKYIFGKKSPVDSAPRRINSGHTNLGTSVKVTVLVNSFLSMTSLPNANTELTPLNSTVLIVKDFRLQKLSKIKSPSSESITFIVPFCIVIWKD